LTCDFLQPIKWVIFFLSQNSWFLINFNRPEGGIEPLWR
jgi:hypothetical protein